MNIPPDKMERKGVSYTYNANNYAYDALGRLTAVSHDDGQSIHYGYDALGNRTSLETQISGVTQTDVDYSYDALNRVQTVTDTIGANPAITEFDYSLIGQMTSISRPNGITTHYSYDPQRYFVDEIEHLDGINLLSRYDYSYDNVGNRTSMDITAQDSSIIEIDYAYDDAYRLTSESYVLAGNALSTTSYQYDRAGNRTQMSNSDGITSYTYNKDDELTEITLPNYMYQLYEYDARGNLTETSLWSDGAIDIQIGSDTNYTYNAKDQLEGYALGGLTSVNYGYDHLGNRVEENISGTPTYYLWDEFSRYGDVILETGVDAGNLNRKMDYVLADGMLISQTDFNGDVQYFLQDAQNSTIALTDDTGTIASNHTFRYDAFGELQGDPDPTALGTKYLYTGQYFDAINTETYNLRARHYNPSNGRFLNRDTWAYDYENPFELNRYAYGANNPTTYADPSGNVVEFVNQLKSYLAGKGMQIVGGALLGGALSAVVSSLMYTQLIDKDLCGDTTMSFKSFVALSTAIGAGLGALMGALPFPLAAKVATRMSIFGLFSNLLDMGMNGGNLCNPLGAVASTIGLGGGTSSIPVLTVSYNILSNSGALLRAPEIVLSWVPAIPNVLVGAGAAVMSVPLYFASSNNDEDDNDGTTASEVDISRNRYPEAAEHIEDAQAEGHPSELTIDRDGASSRRLESLRNYPTDTGHTPPYDRDEYPPAVFEEGGEGASVRYIPRGDNRGAGAVIGNRIRGLPNGSRVRITVVP